MRTNERSIRYGEDLYVSDVIVFNTIGGEFTMMGILDYDSYDRPYPKTVLGPVPYPLCPVLGYDVGKVQKLESLEL